MARFKSIIFYQNEPKIKLFLLKNKNFPGLGAPPPNPKWPPVDRDGTLGPQKQSPQLQISSYAKHVLLILPDFRILL